MSSTAVLCTTPPGAAGAVAVGLVAGDGVWRSDVLFVMRRPAVSVSSVSPSQGGMGGGGEVTVSGASFPAVDDVVVFFGRTRAAVVSSSAHSVVCLAPESDVADRVLIRVTDSDHTHVALNADVFYSFTRDVTLPLPTPKCFVHDLFPSSGPISGGTMVTVVGAAFPPSQRVKCSFGAKRVLGTVVSSSVSVCASPAAHAGVQEVAVYAGDACVAQGATSFHYYTQPSILDTTPSSGPVGTSVLVSISPLEPSQTSAVSCVFGPLASTPATWVSASSLSCAAPPLTPGNVTLHLEREGRPYTLQVTLHPKPQTIHPKS